MRQPHVDLSRRERQIVDILYTQGRATRCRGAVGAAGSAELFRRPGDAAHP